MALSGLGTRTALRVSARLFSSRPTTTSTSVRYASTSSSSAEASSSSNASSSDESASSAPSSTSASDRAEMDRELFPKFDHEEAQRVAEIRESLVRDYRKKVNATKFDFNVEMMLIWILIVFCLMEWSGFNWWDPPISTSDPPPNINNRYSRKE